MIEKIEEFLFDILGLILPGLITIALLFSPLLVIKPDEINKIFKQNEFVFLGLKTFYNSNKTYSIIIILIICYILGHVIKVLSKYLYDFFRVIFDDGVIKFVKYINKMLFFKRYNEVKNNNKFDILIYILKKDYRRTWGKKLNGEKTKIWYIGIIDFVLGVSNFINNILRDILSFDPPSYYSSNDNIKDNVVEKINSKFNIEFPKVWYSIYKISNIIMSQEKVKSLSFRFLAKYNFYRSLSLVFLLNIFYIFFCFNNLGIEKSAHNLYHIILIVNFILWLTFHEKFKRYWTLCGNESLMSLFYFLSKPEKANDKTEEVNGK